MRYLQLLLISMAIAGCGGGGVSALNASSYQVGGTLSGLPDGASVVLTNNGADDLTLSRNGAFTFATSVSTGTRYAVAIKSVTPATGVLCSVANASSNSILGPVGNVAVNCGPLSYTLAGSIQGLSKGANLSLKLNLTLPDKSIRSQTLAVVGDGNAKQDISFLGIPTGSTVSVEVLTPPSAGQVCEATGWPTPTMTSNASGLAVNCTGKTFAIYAKVTGLQTGQKVTLINSPNSGKVESLSITSLNATSAKFSAPVQFMGDYAVSIDTDPAKTDSTLLCTLGPGSQGTAVTSDVTVNVACGGRDGYTISVKTSYLRADQSLTLYLNNSLASNTLNIKGSASSGSGSIISSFNTLAFGSPYVVSVGIPPTKQTCSVINGQGKVLADVSTVQVECSDYLWLVSTLSSVDSVDLPATFSHPGSLASWTDPSTNKRYFFISEPASNRIRRLSPAIGAAPGDDPTVLDVYAGTGLPGAFSGSTGRTSSFSGPTGLAVDSAGRLFVADTLNHVIRKIEPNSGQVSIFAGSAGVTGSDDSSATTPARFNRPSGLAIDQAGNLYVADTGNNTIRKITPSGVVSTLAGKAGSAGMTDETGVSALFNGPTGLTVGSPDATGTAQVLYVADTDNSKIRLVDMTSLKVSTFAGTVNGGYADGPRAFASFNQPSGLIVDSRNNYVYVADTFNNVIRQVDSMGVVSTIAGNISAGTSDGYGWAARFGGPSAFLVFKGDLYVLDRGNSLIRKLKLVPSPP